ncbi:MAG: hypothetical protein RL247_974 [Actinomycetota bacterium]
MVSVMFLSFRGRAVARVATLRLSTVSQDGTEVNHCGLCCVSLHKRNMRVVNISSEFFWSETHNRGTLNSVSSSTGDAWLTVPEVCERLGLTPGKVHRLVEQRALLGVKRDGVFRIPDLFLNGNEPVSDLKGTALLLLDGGFTEDSAIEWLLGEHDALGTSPISAIREGRKTEVRRLAQTLAF